MSWSQAIEACENLIRAGQSQQVINLLIGIKLKDIPRSHIQKFAHLYYRVGLFNQGLRTLTPIIYPKQANLSPATEIEIATYAVLLIKIGSVVEAQTLLATLSSQIPEVDLYRAFAEQAVWAYDEAIPHLRKYLARPGISLYERAVAEVNLAAALISTNEITESQTLLAELLPRARENQWHLILKNSQELVGQLAAAQGDYSEAKRLLAEAASHRHSADHGVFDFFIDKWQAIVDLRQDPDSPEARSRMKVIRNRAVEISHWESVRECDRVTALALRDVALLNQVYFGTFFPSYRQRLVREAAAWTQPSPEFIWGSKDGLIFDLSTGQTDGGEIQLKAGQSLHRALVALASDRYRPLFVGQLFSRAYPGECFIAEFSAGRVAALVSRLRKWILENNLPLTIEVKDQFHRLIFNEQVSKFGFRFESNLLPQINESSMSSNLLRLQNKMGSELFSSSVAAQTLAISKSSAVRLIGWGLKQGKLKAMGNNKTAKYGFAA